jgi:hypothetical protein
MARGKKTSFLSLYYSYSQLLQKAWGRSNHFFLTLLMIILHPHAAAFLPPTTATMADDRHQKVQERGMQGHRNGRGRACRPHSLPARHRPHHGSVDGKEIHNAIVLEKLAISCGWKMALVRCALGPDATRGGQGGEWQAHCKDAADLLMQHLGPTPR